MSVERPISEDDLHAYVDGALEPGRRFEVDQYLAHHEDVARRVAGYAAQRTALRSALAPVAAEPIPPELSLARLVEQRRRPALSWRALAAAVLLFVLGGAGGWVLQASFQPPRGGILALADEAADSYAVYEPDHIHPVELRAQDRDQLVQWISQRLQRRVAAPDLAASGYRFMGGRLVATAHGPAGMFMDDDDHTRPQGFHRKPDQHFHCDGQQRMPALHAAPRRPAGFPQGHRRKDARLRRLLGKPAVYLARKSGR